MGYLIDLWETLSKWWMTVTGLDPKILELLLGTGAVVVIYFLTSLLARRVINRKFDDVAKRYTARKTTNYVLGILLFLVIARIWIAETAGLFTFLGLLTAGLAIALQDPITNFAGWLFVVIRQPFKVGDRIQIGTDQAGDIIDQRLFSFSILEIGNWVDADQSTGRIIHIPNGVVFKTPIANFTQGFEFIWNEIPVTVTFESDWKKSKKILEEVAEQHCTHFSKNATAQINRTANQYLIFFRKLTPIVWVTVVDIGVTLTIRYLCAVRQRRSSETTIWTEILDRFAKEPTIDFAYPTQRFYNNSLEGKPGAGGPSVTPAIVKDSPSKPTSREEK